MSKIWSIIVVYGIGCYAGFSQEVDFTAIRAEVDFSRTLQEWDGFGFNYVETAHTSDMKNFNQEYGGFSLLDNEEKLEIIDLVFGEDGLKVGLIKMFLGSLHQKEAGGPFDHKYTTENMRFFVREGLKTTRTRGGDLEIITTLYGPPGYTTKQKAHRGRDLDPEYKDAVADYMVDWVKFLREEEHFSVIGFTSNGTMHPDAFIVTNINEQDQKVKVWIKGSKAKYFEAFRTTKSPGSDLDDIDEKYLSLGDIQVADGAILIDAPAGSVTTFYAK